MEKVKQIQVGSQTVGGDGKLFVMAGPCVIETRNGPWPLARP